MGPIRVFHCDDSGSFRLLVREVLGDAEGVELVGEASSVDEALAALPGARPDVVLLDRIGGNDEDVLVAALKQAAPDARFVVYSGMPTRTGATADAYVHKAVTFDELHRVVLEVAGRA